MDVSTSIFARLWNSKPVVLVRTVFEVYDIARILIALALSPLLPAAAIAGLAFLRGVSVWQVFMIGAGIYVLTLAVVLGALSKMSPVKRRVKDKGLRQRCCNLSGRLFAFLENRSPDHPQKRFEAAMMDPSEGDASGHLQEAVRYNMETEEVYEDRFSRDVERLLDALERRGWSDAEEQKKLEARWWSMELPDDRIRRIAQHLENVCHNAL